MFSAIFPSRRIAAANKAQMRLNALIVERRRLEREFFDGAVRNADMASALRPAPAQACEMVLDAAPAVLGERGE
jgi:hypothetical protein